MEKLFANFKFFIKKSVVVVLIMTLLTVTGCEENGALTKIVEDAKEAWDNIGTEGKEENKKSGSKSAHEGDTINITFPQELLLGLELTKDDINEAYEKDGMKIIPNGDGSYTATMSKEKHDELIDQMYDALDESIKNFKEISTSNPITDIKYNESFNEFIFYCNIKKYSEVDEFTALYDSNIYGTMISTIAISLPYFQSFYGVAPDSIDSAFIYIDNSTDNEFFRANLSDYFSYTDYLKFYDLSDADLSNHSNSDDYLNDISLSGMMEIGEKLAEMIPPLYSHFTEADGIAVSEAIKYNIKIIGENGDVLCNLTNAEITGENITVLDATISACGKVGLALILDDSKQYVEQISDLTNGMYGVEYYFWNVSLNSVELSSGSNDYKISNGDSITWEWMVYDDTSK